MPYDPATIAFLPRDVVNAAGTPQEGALRNRLWAFPQWAAGGYVHSQFTGQQSDFYSRAARPGELESIRRAREAAANPHLSNTLAGMRDVSDDNGVLAIMPAPPGLPVGHPTLAPEFTGPAPNPNASGLVTGPNGNTLLPDPNLAVAPSQEVSALADGLARALVPAGPMEYDPNRAFNNMSAKERIGINVMMDEMAKALDPDTSPFQKTAQPSGDVCAQIFDELRAHVNDLGDTNAQARLVKSLHALGTATESTKTGKEILLHADRVMNGEGNYKKLARLIKKGCELVLKAAKKVGLRGQTGRMASDQGVPVSDKDAAWRSQKDFGAASKRKDREDWTGLDDVEEQRVKRQKPIGWI